MNALEQPTEVLSPIQAANLLTLAEHVKGIGQFKMLLHLIAHPWPHTCHDLREHTGLSQGVVWDQLNALTSLKLVEIIGSEPNAIARGPGRLLYQVKGGHRHAAA